MTTITADYTTLMRQSGDTVEVYLSRAVRMLDDQFGDNYASKNPALVGQLVASMAADLTSATFGKTIGELADVIENKDFYGH